MKVQNIRGGGGGGGASFSLAVNRLEPLSLISVR